MSARRRIDPGTTVFLLLLVALLIPSHLVAWCLYILGVGNILSFLFFLAVYRSHNKADAPGWAKVALAPLSGYLKFNLVLVAIGLAVLWQFYPLWGGA